MRMPVVAAFCAGAMAAASFTVRADDSAGAVIGPPPPRAIVTWAEASAPIELNRSRQVVTANVLQAGLLIFGYLSGAGYFGPGFVMDNSDRKDPRLAGVQGPLPATATGLQTRLGLQQGDAFAEPTRLRVQATRWRLDLEPMGNRYELLYEARVERASDAGADVVPLASCVVKGGAAPLDEWAAAGAQRLQNAVADIADECASLMEASLAAAFPPQQRVAGAATGAAAASAPPSDVNARSEGDAPAAEPGARR